MKKEIAFIAVMMILGIISGLLITAILAGIAVPAYSGGFFTIEEKESLELMERTFGWVSKNIKLITPISIFPLAVIAYVLFIFNLNPNIKKEMLKKKTGILKALTVFLVGVGAYLFIFYYSAGAINDMGYFSLSSLLDKALVIKLLAVPLIGGLFWIIAGEMGWAGDLSSWKMGTQEKKAKPFLCFIFGVIVSVAIMGVSSISVWAMSKYFILANQVLGKSEVISSFGFKLLYGYMFLLSLPLAITAGLVVALSPVYMETKARFKRLIFPGVLVVIMVTAVFGTYQYALAKYDFDKKDIAEAVGISDKTSIIRTILFFKQDKKGNEIILLEWPMEVVYFNPLFKQDKKEFEKANKMFLEKGHIQMSLSRFPGMDTIELSQENLGKIQDYLLDHKDGSVFNRTAEHVLHYGYHALWDMEKALERQFLSSQHQLISRLFMIVRMQYLSITPQNLKYLESFADETKWHINGRFALSIALSFSHFGMPDEAQKWIVKAKQRGAKSEMVAAVQKRLPTAPILTKGKIYGSITVNGEAPLNTKVAILNSRGTDGDNVFESSNHFAESIQSVLPTRLIGAKKLDHQGRFIFEHLGEGKYFLGLMTDKEVIPYNISSEKITVKNSPGVIELGGKVSEVDVGNIDIVVK